MRDGPCPICPACRSHDVKWIEATSRDADVHYCRCDKCAHVFAVTKEPPYEIRHVTPLPES